MCNLSHYLKFNGQSWFRITFIVLLMVKEEESEVWWRERLYEWNCIVSISLQNPSTILILCELKMNHKCSVYGRKQKRESNGKISDFCKGVYVGCWLPATNLCCITPQKTDLLSQYADLLKRKSSTGWWSSNLLFRIESTIRLLVWCTCWLIWSCDLFFGW